MATSKTIPSRKSKAAVSHIGISIASDTSFDTLVGILKETLVVPELPGLRGCRPCLSGLDKFIIEDIAMKGMR